MRGPARLVYKLSSRAARDVTQKKKSVWKRNSGKDKKGGESVCKGSGGGGVR